jgi:hydrogenase 3 maturation protease
MPSDWKERLSGVLAQSRRLAFVGVGQELRGDDAVGVLLVRRLQRADPPSTDSPLPTARWYFEAGPLPEASAGPLRRFRPDWVIFLDAAETGEPPGTVRWIEPDNIEDGSASTHTFPIGGFAAYLTAELGCRVAVLGIQPESMEFDTPACGEIHHAVDEIAGLILAGSARS